MVYTGDMPYVFTHFAIAKKYLEKNKDAGIVKNRQDFFDGNIVVDLAMGSDKEHSHYGDRSEMVDLVKHNREKIDLRKFLERNALDSDLNLGRFLHLYTDWEFYNNFLPIEYMKTITMEQFSKDFRYTTSLHEDYLGKKYDLCIDMTTMGERLREVMKTFELCDMEKRGYNGFSSAKTLYSAEGLDAFIERIASVDLYAVAEKFKHGELMDVYDKDGKHVGIMHRCEAVAEGSRVFIKGVDILIVNDEGEVLVQKRSATKKSQPNKWDISCSGAVGVGEDLTTACRREVFEELGVDIAQEKFIFQRALPGGVGFLNNGLQHIFIVKMNLEIGDIKIDPKEVAEVKWLSLEDFEKLLYSAEFTPYKDEYKDIIMDVVKRSKDEN